MPRLTGRALRRRPGKPPTRKPLRKPPGPSGLRKCPQVLVNVRFAGGVDPVKHPKVVQACEDVTQAMNGRGRVLLRKSGTEPLVRVMVEGEDEATVRGHADALAKLVTEVCA